MGKCWSPFTKRMYKVNNDGINYDLTDIPCGKCVACIRQRTTSWAVRILEHEKVQTSSYFLTFTYDTRTIPITPEGLFSLEPKHLTLYWKRLRKAHAKRYGKTAPKITYYAVGEYGGQTERPHYHALIFNAHLDDIVNAWPYGFTYVGTCEGGAVGYVLKYLAKDFSTQAANGLVKPFSRMSEGIGDNYLTQAKIAWHNADAINRVYYPDLDGRKKPLPRRWKQRLYQGETWRLINEYFRTEADLAEPLTDQEKADLVASQLAEQTTFKTKARRGEKI